MTRKGRRKRKNRGSSDGNTSPTTKVLKVGGPVGGSEDPELSVSDLLSQTNSALYDDGNESVVLNVTSSSVCADSVFSWPVGKETTERDKLKMASNQSTEPSNADIIRYLEKIDNRLGNMEGKISGLEKRFSALEEVKDKVENFDKELKKLWNVLNDRQKKTDERIRVVEDRVESQDFASGLLHDKVVNIEREKDMLKDEVMYLQSLSMRNNLVFRTFLRRRGRQARMLNPK